MVTLLCKLPSLVNFFSIAMADTLLQGWEILRYHCDTVILNPMIIVPKIFFEYRNTGNTIITANTMIIIKVYCSNILSLQYECIVCLVCTYITVTVGSK